jgi:hypothetical protein
MARREPLPPVTIKDAIERAQEVNEIIYLWGYSWSSVAIIAEKMVKLAQQRALQESN